jgi:hypothetical protein
VFIATLFIARCRKGENPKRGFSRELIECTQCVGIEIVNSGETLREVQSLKEDKSWKINPGRIVKEIPRSHLKMTRREYLSNKDIT